VFYELSGSMMGSLSQDFGGNFSGTLLPPGLEDEDSLATNTSWWNVTEEGESEDAITPNTIGLAILLFLFCAATVFGNALIVVSVARERYLHSVTNYFITSLAVADCLVGLLVMPFQAIFELMNKRWIFGEYWCDLWHSLDVLASTSSILNLCVISLDRYWGNVNNISFTLFTQLMMMMMMILFII
jgi:hypothetical protein